MTPLFSSDSRAVSPLVGFILLFGILVIGLSLYQAAIVPQDNARAEFTHNQELQNDFLDLRDATHNTGVDTISRTASISLGTAYNPRIITINPVPPAGTLSTSDPGKNITVEPDSDTAWNFSTRTIQYEPQYREYQTPPTTFIEHTLVYNDFGDDTTQIRSGQRLIEPDELVIPIIEGDVSKNSDETESLRVVYREQQTKEISDNVTVTLPTTEPGVWEEAAINEHQNYTATTDSDTLTIEADVEQLTLYRIELSEDIVTSPDDTISNEID